MRGLRQGAGLGIWYDISRLSNESAGGLRAHRELHSAKVGRTQRTCKLPFCTFRILAWPHHILLCALGLDVSRSRGEGLQAASLLQVIQPLLLLPILYDHHGWFINSINRPWL